MSMQIEQLGLSQTIAQQSKINQHIVEAFIGQLFNEIEKNLVIDARIKIEGLGLFRIIKSGDAHRILFLGSNAPIEIPIAVQKQPQVKLEVQIDKVEDIHPNVDVQFVEIAEERHSEEEIAFNEAKKEQVSDEGLSEADAIVIQNFHKSEKRSHVNQAPLENPRKSNLVKTCIITLIVLSILTLGYIILSGASPNRQNKENQSVIFKELDNIDSLNYNRIIIPESDVSLQYIAKIYYGNDAFWPYIYEANKNIVNNLLIVQAGSITKIPKVSVDLANLNSGKEVLDAKILGDIIYKEIR